jgi:hypothetical protein
MNFGPQFEDLPTNDLEPWLSAEMDWDVFQYECETMYITMDYDPWNMEQIAGSDFSQDGNHISLSMMDPLQHMSSSVFTTIETIECISFNIISYRQILIAISSFSVKYQVYLRLSRR